MSSPSIHPSASEEGIIFTPAQLASLLSQIRANALQEQQQVQQASFHTLAQTHESETSQLRLEINRLEQTIDNLESQREGSERRVQRLGNQISELEEQLATAQGLDTRNIALERQNTSLRLEIPRLEREIETLQQKLRYAVREEESLSLGSTVKGVEGGYGAYVRRNGGLGGFGNGSSSAGGGGNAPMARMYRDRVDEEQGERVESYLGKRKI